MSTIFFLSIFEFVVVCIGIYLVQYIRDVIKVRRKPENFEIPTPVINFGGQEWTARGFIQFKQRSADSEQSNIYVRGWATKMLVFAVIGLAAMIYIFVALLIEYFMGDIKF